MYNISPNTLFIGRKVQFIDYCSSTNSEAYSLISKNKAIEGDLVICHDQRDGRGQVGNSWESEPGKNLTFSVILSPKFLPVMSQFDLNVVVSLAIQETLSHFVSNGTAKIKWPNDILLNDRKVCGILIENSMQGTQFKWSIVGVGLNVNQLKFIHPNAISMAQVGGELTLPLVLEYLLERLESYYIQLRNKGSLVLRAKYMSELAGINQVHRYRDDSGEFEGVITGLDKFGKIEIEVKGEKRYYAFKEVEFLSLYQ